MRSFVLYGLDREGRVAFTEIFAAPTREWVRQRATKRLEEFHHVEVWESAVCVFRGASSRRGEAPRG